MPNVTEWLGITVENNTDGIQRVTRINWSNQGLDGVISDAFGDFTELKELKLQNNDLKGKLPASLGGLNKLTKLNLGRNFGLIGGIPSSVLPMKNRLDGGTYSEFLVDQTMSYEETKWHQRDQDRSNLLMIWEEMGGRKEHLIDPDQVNLR